MCGRNCQPCQRCQQPNTSSRISASGVKDADFVESFLRRWHSRSCFRIDGQKIYREPKGKIVRKMFKYRLYPTRPQTEALIGTTVRSVPPLQRCASRAHRGVSNAPQIYQLLRPSGTVDRNSQSRRPRSSQLPLCSRCAEALRESIQGVFSTHQARTEARVSSLQIVSSLR